LSQVTLNSSVQAKLAVRYSLYDGAVTFVVMPYATMRNNRAVSDFKAQIHDGEMTAFQTAFLAIEGFVLDMEFAAGELTPMPNSWRVYWQESRQCASIQERWTLFELIAGDHFTRDWWEVYAQTRDRAYDAPEPITVPKEDEAAPQS